MNISLQARFEANEKLKEKALNLLSTYSEQQLNTPYGPEKWSPGQVAIHVILGEELTLGYMKLKIQDRSRLNKSGFKAFLKSLILGLALKSPLKFKAPEFTANVPSRVSIAEIIDRWALVRKDFIGFLEEFPEDLVDREIFKHPVVGRINISQTLDFLADHLRHHLPQISANK